ncbi:MAG: protein kinase [Labilithrix sp.]|nr:protein kinase [Labilithrix sp.]
MATLSWSSTLARSGAATGDEDRTDLRPKDVAEDGTLGNPSIVPEAHAGMMVTPSVKLVRPLGEGGMGAVWVADHIALRTQVVVKFIASGLKDSKEATERFSREAAAAAQVKSPHVVQTFDHGFTPDGVPYIVMELLEGRDLGAFLDAEVRCAPQLVVEIIAQLARALDRAHERGIVHRDIKPGNLFLCDGGRGDVFVKLLDFGIAKGVDVPLVDSGTKTGAMIGSPFYMSPEQILGSKTLDHRSDLWSVGVVAYEALTGEKPFDAETMGGLAIKIHSEPLPYPSTKVPGLSPAVDAWFHRACSRAVPDRFATAKEMAEALAAALGGEMPRSVDLPRSSTGSNGGARAVEHDATLVAGATTEAGIVSVTSPRSSQTTRNRVLAVMAFGAVLCLGTFGAVTALKKGDDTKGGHALTADPAPVQPSAPPVPSSSVAEPSPIKIVDAVPSDVASAATSAQPAPPTTKASGHNGHGKHPTGSSTSSRPPLPSSASTAPVPPAPTGHDIF